MASGEEDQLRAALDELAEAEQRGAVDDAEAEPASEPPLVSRPEPGLQPTGNLEDFFCGDQPSPPSCQLESSTVAGGAVASDVEPWILLSPQQPSPLSQPADSGEGADGVVVSEAADILADFFGSCTHDTDRVSLMHWPCRN